MRPLCRVRGLIRIWDVDLVPRAPANKAADVEHRPLGGEYPDVSAGVSGACF